MKKLSFLIAILFIAATSFAQNANSIVGIWLNQEKDAKIEIYKSGDKYYGKLIWGKNIFEADGKTSKKDTKNTDASQRSRNLLNLIILKDFVYDEDDKEWTDGTIYDPKNGKTYSCVMSIENSSLHITGYIGFTWIGRTVVWTRP
jgi:uncharacterized protein (DUF2147 family)